MEVARFLRQFLARDVVSMYYYVIELWVDKEDEYRQDLFQKYLFIDCVTVETRSVDKLIRPQREIDKGLTYILFVFRDLLQQ